jgi:hypothetical protein
MQGSGALLSACCLLSAVCCLLSAVSAAVSAPPYVRPGSTTALGLASALPPAAALVQRRRGVGRAAAGSKGDDTERFL